MPLPAAKQRNKQKDRKGNRDMATIGHGFCDGPQIGVHKMSYDEFCIAAFGKGVEDYSGKEKTAKEQLKNKNNHRAKILLYTR